MDHGLIIRDDCIARVDNQADTVPLGQYAKTLVRFSERGETDEPIPHGVRFLIHRLPATLVVIEEPPQMRTVQWLDDDSTDPFGDKAEYRQVRLAFPYIVIIALFMRGLLTTRTQCFYRTAPIARRDDRLFIPNLYNVDNREDMSCWLCLKKLDGIGRTHSWSDRVHAIQRHFWNATFNRSATLDRHKSYWWKMKGLDRRVSSLDHWEAASEKNPLFPLDVPWLSLPHTLGETMDTMLNKMVSPDRFALTQDWISLLPPIESRMAEAAP